MFQSLIRKISSDGKGSADASPQINPSAAQSLESPGDFFAGSGDKNDQSMRCSQIDSSSKYVNDLENVLLFVVKETVMDDFKVPGTDEIEYKILLNALLMPFF